MVGEIQHPLDARLHAAAPRQRDGLAHGDADLPGRRHGPVAAGEQQQLAPRIDQQTDLVINLGG